MKSEVDWLTLFLLIKKIFVDKKQKLMRDMRRIYVRPSRLQFHLTVFHCHENWSKIFFWLRFIRILHYFLPSIERAKPFSIWIYVALMFTMNLNSISLLEYAPGLKQHNIFLVSTLTCRVDEIFLKICKKGVFFRLNWPRIIKSNETNFLKWLQLELNPQPLTS